MTDEPIKFIMTEDEMFEDWLANEVQGQLERLLRLAGPIAYTDASMTRLAQLVDEVIARIDPEEWAELHRRAAELMARINQS